MNEKTSETDDFRARARARGEAKNAAARAALEPLQPGERPTAITVAVIVAMLYAAANIVAIFFIDVDTDNERGAIVQQILVAAVLLVAAAGMWKSKYWAVLGFQTMLAFSVILAFAGILTATDFWLILPFVATIIGFSTLFWFLIRAMARIQMPDSPTQRKLREHPNPADRHEDSNKDRDD